MSFEKIGRADKQGNVYENRCISRILIRLVAEEITSVVVEPVEKTLIFVSSIPLQRTEAKHTTSAKAAME